MSGANRRTVKIQAKDSIYTEANSAYKSTEDAHACSLGLPMRPNRSSHNGYDHILSIYWCPSPLPPLSNENSLKKSKRNQYKDNTGKKYNFKYGITILETRKRNKR